MAFPYSFEYFLFCEASSQSLDYIKFFIVGQSVPSLFKHSVDKPTDKGTASFVRFAFDFTLSVIDTAFVIDSEPSIHFGKPCDTLESLFLTNCEGI